MSNQARKVLVDLTRDADSAIDGGSSRAYMDRSGTVPGLPSLIVLSCTVEKVTNDSVTVTLWPSFKFFGAEGLVEPGEKLTLGEAEKILAELIQQGRVQA